MLILNIFLKNLAYPLNHFAYPNLGTEDLDEIYSVCITVSVWNHFFCSARNFETWIVEVICMWLTMFICERHDGYCLTDPISMCWQPRRTWRKDLLWQDLLHRTSISGKTSSWTPCDTALNETHIILNWPIADIITQHNALTLHRYLTMMDVTQPQALYHYVRQVDHIIISQMCSSTADIPVIYLQTCDVIQNFAVYWHCNCFFFCSDVEQWDQLEDD